MVTLLKTIFSGGLLSLALCSRVGEGIRGSYPIGVRWRRLLA
jgi:hypothetical protein